VLELSGYLEMSLVSIHQSVTSGPFSRRTWADEWRYQTLYDSVNVKTVHQKKREEQEAERKAKEAAKRLKMKEAAAEARRKAIEKKKKTIEEARLRLAQRGTKHKKRAAKKAFKKESESLLRHIDKELDEVDLEALEEELRVLEEEEVMESRTSETLLEEADIPQEAGITGESDLMIATDLGTIFRTLEENSHRELLEEARINSDKEEARKKTAKMERKREAKAIEEESIGIKAAEEEAEEQLRKQKADPTFSDFLQSRISLGLSQHVLPPAPGVLLQGGVRIRAEERKLEEEVERKKAENEEAADKDMLQSIEERSLNAAKELIEQRRLKAEKEEKIILEQAKLTARKEMNQVMLKDLKAKAEQAKDAAARSISAFNDAYDAACEHLLLVDHDKREAKIAAEAAKAAEEKAKRAAESAKAAAEKADMTAELARESQEQLAALAYIENHMRVEAEIAKEKYQETLAELKRVENEICNEIITPEKVMEANPFLDFINEAIKTKSQDLQCPVCLEEASSPIYSCPARGHILCSSCRPAVSSCPECRQSLGKEWVRHRFAERTAEELEGLRKKLENM